MSAYPAALTLRYSECMKFRVVFPLILAFTLAGCTGDDDDRVAFERDLRASLSAGDPAQKIERVLKEKGLPVVFNRFDGRYETGTGRDSKRSATRVVRAHIYLDTHDRLSQVEVRNVYTWF
jgi:hypothetical protein